MSAEKSIVPAERIRDCILLIRGQKVILDKDLAVLYRLTTGSLNKAVTRNIARFLSDFMFRLTGDEFEDLKFHFGTSSWGGTPKCPRAFTEQGVAMLSSVLRSKPQSKICNRTAPPAPPKRKQIGYHPGFPGLGFVLGYNRASLDRINKGFFQHRGQGIWRIQWVKAARNAIRVGSDSSLKLCHDGSSRPSWNAFDDSGPPSRCHDDGTTRRNGGNTSEATEIRRRPTRIDPKHPAEGRFAQHYGLAKPDQALPEPKTALTSPEDTIQSLERPTMVVGVTLSGKSQMKPQGPS